MGSLRERYQVSWDGNEPVEVETTVKDLMTAADLLPSGQQQNVIRLETTLIYCALSRKGQDIPPYDDWVLVLDNYTKVGTVITVEGPTQGAALSAGQLPSVASQEPTGEAGLTTTTDPSSLLNSFS